MKERGELLYNLDKKHWWQNTWDLGKPDIIWKYK